jgi:hypothetical protein
VTDHPIDRREFVQWVAASLIGAGMLASCDDDSPSTPTTPRENVFADDLSSSWGPEWLSLRYETRLQVLAGGVGLEMAPAVKDALDDAFYMAYPVIVTSVQADEVLVRGDVRGGDASGAGVIVRSSFDACYALIVTPGELQLSRYSPAGRTILDRAQLPHDGWWSLSLSAVGGRLLGSAQSGSEHVEVEARDAQPLPSGHVGVLGIPLRSDDNDRVLFRRFQVDAGRSRNDRRPQFVYAFTGAVVPRGRGFEAKVTARTLLAQPLAFEISSDPSFETSECTAVFPTEGGLSSVHGKLRNLRGGTEYYWRPVATRGGIDVHGPIRQFRTPPAPGESVKFVFASCTAGGQTSYPSFHTARKLDPDFYLHAGDWGYVDGFALRKSADHFQTWWIRMMNCDGIAELLETTPLMFWQDDHDYDADFGWAETVNPEAVKAFDELNANPSDEFFDVRWGDVHVWCLDCRKYATDPSKPDGPKKSRIGEEQKTWLKDGMRTSDAPVRIVATSMVFRNKNDREPGWHNTFAVERDELLEFFTTLDATVVILSGDSHGHRLIHHFEFGELYEINSSGTDFRFNGEAGNFDPEHTLINHAEENGFAEIVLEPQGPQRQLSVRVVEREGSTLFEKKFPVS